MTTTSAQAGPRGEAGAEGEGEGEVVAGAAVGAAVGAGVGGEVVPDGGRKKKSPRATPLIFEDPAATATRMKMTQAAEIPAPQGGEAAVRPPRRPSEAGAGAEDVGGGGVAAGVVAGAGAVERATHWRLRRHSSPWCPLPPTAWTATPMRAPDSSGLTAS